MLYHLVFLAMMSKLDESVGRVVSALNGRGMLKNSIIVFMSDNGAPIPMAFTIIEAVIIHSEV